MPSLAWGVAATFILTDPVRAYEGPTSVEPPAEATVSSEPVADASDGSGTQASVPPPRPVEQQHLSIAVGLAPEAPGTAEERRHLEALERHARASTQPSARVRRLRPGTGSAREICRERQDDLVVQIGYVPQRSVPVVITHDCRLDVPLELRGTEAAHAQGLVSALWTEHRRLVDEGYKERRRLLRVKPAVRVALISTAVAAVLGVAVGVLVASTLREEKVVLKVSP